MHTKWTVLGGLLSVHNCVDLLPSVCLSFVMLYCSISLVFLMHAIARVSSKMLKMNMGHSTER
jgi:hypothetical protein